MTLKLKLNLILSGVLLLVLAAWIVREVEFIRHSVQEEINASHRVATQLLAPLMQAAGVHGMPALQALLPALGRVRANELRLLDEAGVELYRSPESPYKAGRDAPAWFGALVTPPLSVRELKLPDGQLLIRPDASRAVLDGWDELVALMPKLAAGFVAFNLVAWVLVGRALRGFPLIVQALDRMQAGDLEVRLPALPGREALAIGTAFNRMVQSVADGMRERERAQRAEQRASESHELALMIERHLEEERRQIARELHDELGQSVTAIRSLAVSITRQPAAAAAVVSAAQIIDTEAARLYDAMHGVIPRLAPLSIEHTSLADALTDLIAQHRSRYPQVQFAFEHSGLPQSLGASATLAFYRAAQEAITNALRHGAPTAIHVAAARTDERIELTVRDNGRGLAGNWQQPGRFGLRGLRERFEALGGSVSVGASPGGGVAVHATLPHDMVGVAA